MDDIVDRLRNHTEGNDMVTHEVVNEAADEIERLRTEVLELRGVVRAHEGLYARAAEEIDKQRGWIERTYRMAVGHGPNWNVFDSWEQAINAYEEAHRG